MCHRLVHLDLKGAPLKPGFLKNLFPLFAKWGATGILLEWEDCFPFKNEFEILSNKLYTTEDALQIIHDAKSAKLDVIPLVQTFGHLEFVLKHRNYIEYREVPLFPSSLCPSHPCSFELIISIVEQVVQLHTGLKYIHVGADEVWHMGHCNHCIARLAAGDSKEDLFLKHVKRLVEGMKLKWPSLHVIMWDDMLRDMDEVLIETYHLKSLVEPMIWHYNSAESFCLPPNVFSKYSYFERVWVAGAFKGATGSCQVLPPLSHHASNILQWTSCVGQLKTHYQGMALTGWSRYDHFAALCELLPVSLTSLGVCLAVLEEKAFGPETVARVEGDLGYLPPNLRLRELGASPEVGRPVLEAVSSFAAVKEAATALLAGQHLQTWFNDWQVARGLVNPMQLVTVVPALNRYISELNDLEKYLRIHMRPMFFDSTIDEWIGSNISPLRNRLQEVVTTANAVIAKATKDVTDVLAGGKKRFTVDEMDC